MSGDGLEGVEDDGPGGDGGDVGDGPLLPQARRRVVAAGEERDVTRQGRATLSLSLTTPLHPALPRKNIAKPCKN